MFSATLFDYNGVLIDDEAVHLAAFRDVLYPHGVSVSERAYWDRYIGFDDARAFYEILHDAGRQATDEQIAEFVAAKRPVYRQRAEQELKAFSGAADLVRRRAAAGPVAVVSGALRDEIELGLDRLDVRALVACIVAAEDTTASKPDPQGYLMALEQLRSRVTLNEPRRLLVIEDSLAGIEAAKAAGMTCIAVAHSYPMEQLLESAADLVLRDIVAIDDEVLADLCLRIHG